MPEPLQEALAHFSPAQWALIVCVMTFGSVIQGAVGFASGLISIPLLVLGGAQIQEAATINFMLTAVQNSVGAWRLREELTFRETALPVVLRWIGLPIGAALLLRASALDPAIVKQALGVLLLIAVLLLWSWKAKHHVQLSLPTTVAAFLTSGLLMGFASIGGPPVVLYVNALNWPASKCRAFLFLVAATGAPLMAVMLAWNFGATLLPACLAAALVFPFVWCGLQLGLRLGKKLNKPVFRQITFVLLTVIAISSILTPMIAGR